MSRRNDQVLSALMVLVFLAGTLAPAAAQEPVFEIELDPWLASEEIDRELDQDQPVRIAAVRSPRELGLPAQVSADQATSAPSDSKVRRTGRWLKKHWWVPTLIGVAVGVVLLEPFDDDDDERRRAQMNP